MLAASICPNVWAGVTHRMRLGLAQASLQISGCNQIVGDKGDIAEIGLDCAGR